MAHHQQHQTNDHVECSTNPGKDCDDRYANWTHGSTSRGRGNVANPRCAVKQREASREKNQEKRRIKRREESREEKNQEKRRIKREAQRERKLACDGQMKSVADFLFESRRRERLLQKHHAIRVHSLIVQVFAGVSGHVNHSETR